ncbi:MAG TPA: ABC transporter permease [Acidimicrobiia bacterium]|nr:ABC transporter permease [Acidimicrobiia bacterium]
MTPVIAAGFFGDVWTFLSDGAHWQGNDGIPHLTLQHLQLTAVSTVVAIAVALPAGVALGHLRRGGALAVNLANVGRALPALGLLILGVQWFGIGRPGGLLSPVHSIPAFVAMVALAIPPIVANAYVGVASVDDDVREAAAGMGMSGRQVLGRVELPIALPLIMAGIRTAVVAVVATATLAAYVDGGGLGTLISVGFATQNDAQVFVGGLFVALLAVALELGLGLLQRALVSQGLRVGGGQTAREIEATLVKTPAPVAARQG